ncbi:MAG: 4-(cytidine 5'-diphospho)-2-C-methyl-D-erythritol kinase [Nanoarchaeota archaeon]|nr:4-(cytidine 5'-diphospho)-2-C-methyl-D-erythritol kinase [Nanoarchaeota archaeon]MBU1005799.1 4-(cytidine 5'-diphospho)-2-C-methyl-D-erythritol kinase [Nanoarchaeota archaeon]MBU1946569.1 4-(cytidine 5'-diphospho)-2-C-methyl-D-erythritol kinase [Nanoarchaeota archaeon]
MQLKSYAKINLSLDVLGKREDSFHEINSVMQKIDLYDELSFEKSKEVIVNSQFKDDIILKAINKVKELFQIEEGITVSLKKNIPVAAGLAGGSSDAATTLIALNELWNLNLTADSLIKIAADIGSDIPFFLSGNTCFVAGRGEIVQPITLPEMNLILVNPGYELSTKQAYSDLDNKHHKTAFSSLKLLSNSKNLKGLGNSKNFQSKNSKNTKEIAQNLHNDFIHIQKDGVNQIINKLIENGALNASITGKGPTVFGIFETQEKAQEAYKNLKDKYPFVHLTKTIN